MCGTLKYYRQIKTDQHCRIFKHELHQLVAQNPGHLIHDEKRLIFQMKTLNNLESFRNDTHLEYNLEGVPILMLILNSYSYSYSYSNSYFSHLTYNLEGILMHGVDLPPPRLPLRLLPLLLDLLRAQRHFLQN